ncbi:MAG: EAL domain-containing protein [Terracidiphilus sp.]|jgi:sensor c-di-GMP phosphodiesterase-like protein
MGRALKQRFLMTLAATLLVAAVGMLSGYLLGKVLACRLAERKLKEDAALIFVAAENLSAESRAVLATMNASTLPFCSDAEMVYFRSLIFKSQYLRDSGRMADGRILCSATAGKTGLPSAPLGAAYAQPDGTSVYWDISALRVGNLTGTLLRAGNSYVVYAPRVMESLHITTSHFSYTQTHIPLPASASENAPSQANANALTTEGQVRVGNTLYTTRCSERYSKCISTYISIPEVLQSERKLLLASSLFGALAGAFFGFLLSLLYQRNRSMEQQLRRAIRKDELRVAYQPIVDLASKRIVGAEALARWTDEDGIAIGPDVFIKVAEKHGFVASITRLVVRHVLIDFTETLRAHPDFRISINVAATDLYDPSFLPMLEQSLDRAGVSAASIVIEITESSTALNHKAVEAIHHLRRLGHNVHIDDFGTGYSSLSYLSDLAVDAIKIDRSFTKAIGTQAVTMAILPQILAMAAALKLEVIVEGIETGQQASYFSTGTEPIFGQGWLFGRPVPSEEFHRLLANGDNATPTEI